MGSARAGSNPAAVAFACALSGSSGGPFAGRKAGHGADKTDPREIRTPNLLIWSQTHYRCAIEPVLIGGPHVARPRPASGIGFRQEKVLRVRIELTTLGL